MFIGHFAVGFAAKRFAPRTSLGVLVLAPVLLDVVFPVLFLAGVERAHIVPGPNPFLMLHLDYLPWSHSLLMALVWGVLLAGVYRWRTGDRAAAFVLAGGVVSHWVLDWVTHRPDMALWPGGAVYGLGLWRSLPATAAVEGALFAGAVWLYARTTVARRTRGTAGFLGFVGFLLLSYVANLTAPAPPDLRAVAAVGLVAQVLMLVWIWWFDRNREIRA